MLKELIIVGAGGFASEVIDLIENVNKNKPQWKILGLIDDNKELQDTIVSSHRVIGQFSWLESQNKPLDIVFAIGDRKTLTEMVKKLKIKSNFYFPNIIHPSIRTDHAKLGYGIMIFQGSIISTNVNLKNHITIGFNSVIGHDVLISDFSYIASGVVINGGVSLSEGVFLGANSTCFPMLKVGKYSTVALGSTAMSDVKDGKTVIGIPAKIIF